MIKAGIICDLKFERHPQFKSYYYALQAFYNDVQIVTCKEDLINIDLLLVGDDHYDRHKELLQSPGFISCLNVLEIPVVVLTSERIFDSYFPWNQENYKVLRSIKHLFHHTSDIDDCVRLKTTLHRIAISKQYKDKFRSEHKLNGMVFIGSTNCLQGSYDNRKRALRLINKTVPMTIIENNGMSWEQYMQTMAGYRFVLCPLGNSNFLTMRFYEVLAVGSIPVQQISQDISQYYDIESKFDDCIFFDRIKDIKQKMDDCHILTSHNEYWAEDNLQRILKEDNLL